MYAYSNNGQSMRAIDDGMQVTGEVAFDHLASDAELLAAFPNYIAPSVLAAKAALQAQAQSLLTASDIQVIRCVESGTTLPAAWVTYRTALRAVVSSGTGTIPIRPDWP